VAEQKGEDRYKYCKVLLLSIKSPSSKINTGISAHKSSTEGLKSGKIAIFVNLGMY